MKCETCAHFKACKRLIDERYEELVPCEEYQSVYTVDAAPVVRCKDCIYRDGTIPGQPNIICFQMHDYDFCSYGERKEPTNGIE